MFFYKSSCLITDQWRAEGVDNPIGYSLPFTTVTSMGVTSQKNQPLSVLKWDVENFCVLRVIGQSKEAFFTFMNDWRVLLTILEPPL